MRRVLPVWMIIVFVAIAACASGTPVYNVESAPLDAPPKATMKDVQNAILRAGANRGWDMKVRGDGHIVGSISRRSHFAVVDIYFTTTNYSIVYQRSENLDYDGTNIHATYNRWIQILQTDIRNQVSTI